MRDFDEDLREAASYHGHLCAGQYIGVRLARCGVRSLGLDDPRACRDLVVFVETDRCLADAVGTVTGCKPGKRRLKFKDYGKSAAVFANIASGAAVRVASKGWVNVPADCDLDAFFAALSDDDLFKVERVAVSLAPGDLPGKPVEKAVCERCGETVTDSRHVVRAGKTLCRNCAGVSYYQTL